MPGVWEKGGRNYFFVIIFFSGNHNTVHMLYYVYGVEFISSFAGGRKKQKYEKKTKFDDFARGK